MGEEATGTKPTDGAPQKCLPKPLDEKAMNKAKQVPAHIVREVNLLLGDARHLVRGDLPKVRPDTMVSLAKLARDYGQDLANGDKTMRLALPVPEVPNLTIVLEFKDLSHATQAKPDGLMLRYEVYRW